MYSPISTPDTSSETEKRKSRWDQKERKSSKRESSPMKKKQHHKHRHKSSHRDKTPDRRRRRENSRETSRDESKDSSRDRRSHHSDSHSSRHSQSSRHKDRETVTDTFLSEMLRYQKTKELVLNKEEETQILEKLAAMKKQQKQEVEDLVEEGEVVSEPEGSFTPKYTPPALKKAKEEVKECNNNDLIPLPDENQVKPKKKSVLELPMPPIVISKRLTSKSATPELRPEHFKFRENHYSEICSHLNDNPVVISPDDDFTEQPKLRARPRPTVLNRPKPNEDFAERSFESFKILEKIGEGTYGKVFKAMDLVSNELVAMKFVRMEKESDGFPITGLREIKILRGLHHENVIRLREIVHHDVVEGSKNETGTFLVFEYMNHDLMGLLDNEAMTFDETTIYWIMRQLLEGLNFCHQRSILHRDLKCSNILVNNSGAVKLADFGLGREWICERPYTNKVISLWYRPIELLLGEEKYGTSVDMWSLGCIFGELFQRRPVFPFNTEYDMIHGIFNLCGTPTKNSWPEVKLLPGYVTLKHKSSRRVLRDQYASILPQLALDLLDKMLTLSPIKRITAEDALKSNWIEFMSQKKNLQGLKLPSEQDCHELYAKNRRKKRIEGLVNENSQKK